MFLTVNAWIIYICFQKKLSILFLGRLLAQVFDKPILWHRRILHTHERQGVGFRHSVTFLCQQMLRHWFHMRVVCCRRILPICLLPEYVFHWTCLTFLLSYLNVVGAIYVLLLFWAVIDTRIWQALSVRDTNSSHSSALSSWISPLHQILTHWFQMWVLCCRGLLPIRRRLGDGFPHYITSLLKQLLSHSVSNIGVGNQSNL